MKPRHHLAALLVMLAALPAAAQFSKHPPRGTLADLGTCDATKEGRIRGVTNGDSVGDCDPTGTGDETVFCGCTEIGGAYAWRAVPQILVGTTPPGSCVVGQFFIDTDDTSGQQLHACESGAFVLQGDGGAGALGADAVDALTEIAQGIKTAANDTDPLAVFTGGNPAGNRCVEINSSGQLLVASDTCANLGPGSAETNDLETTAPPSVADTEIFIGTGLGTGIFAAISGDAALSNAGVLTVLSGDSATGFWPAGTCEHERGCLEADVSAYSGLVYIAGGATSEVSNLAALETVLGAISLAEAGDLVNVEEDNFPQATDAGAIDFGSGFDVACAIGECDITLDVTESPLAALGTPATADISDVSVAQTELAELETIGATTISANQWALLGGVAETLGFAELNLLDGITVLSGSNTGDDTNADTLDTLDSVAFAILAGQAGGQTLIGGTSAGDDLALQTTSNVSKGSYILTELASCDTIDTDVSGVLSCGTDDIGTDSADDLSDDLITALSGVTTVTDGSLCQGGAGSSMDCDLALPSGGTNGCSGASDKPLYNSVTNTWSCGTDAGAGGGMTSFTVQADDTNTMTVTDGETVDIAGGLGFTTTAATGSPEQLTVLYDWTQTLAGNPALLVDQCIPVATATGGGFLCEGSTADTNEQLYLFPDANGADTSGEITILGQTISTGELDFSDFHDIGGTDDDVPESGDFGNATDLESTGAISANAVALGTDTAGNYVLDVADGTGIDGTAAAEGATYTPTLDLTEINSITWGDNTQATITHTWDPTGSTGPVWSYSDGVANLSTGALQVGGVAVDTGGHFSPTAGLSTDHGATAVGDTDITAGAVDGGAGGEIADGTVDANDLATDAVSADELNATGVEAELEAVLDLNELQGAVTDGQVPDTITASSYLPLAGGVMTAEFTADALGIEFEAGDAITDCTTFAATGGGIFFDDSEGVLKKCEDNVLTVLDTTGGTPAFSAITSGTNTGADMTVGSGATIEPSSGGIIKATETVFEAYNNSGATLPKCAAVYISGFNVGADLDEISVADADTVDDGDSAIGLVLADISTASAGYIATFGELTGLDTNTGESWSAGDPLYVNTSGTATTTDCADSLTNVKPAGSGVGIQKIGVVGRVHVSNGTIEISGANRANDLPNIADDSLWVGGSTGVPAAEALPDTDADGQALGWDQATNAFANNPNVGATVDAGEYAAASVDGDDVNSNIAGRSLTLTAGSPDTLDADAELYTGGFTLTWEDAVAGDSGELQHFAPVSLTITKVKCSVSGTLAATINLNERAEATPNTTGVDVLSAGLVCSTTTQSSCASACDVNTITNGSIDLDDPIALEIDSASGSGQLRVHVTYTVDD